jgi:hypothetical protein
MAKFPTAEVTLAEMNALFDALGIPSKVRDGRWTVVPIERTRGAGRGRYIGGVSHIVYLYNELGFHVATAHRITMPDGSVPPWHGKGVLVGACTIVYPSMD